MANDHSKWATRQIAAAIDLGVNPIDAASAVKAFLALLPPGADPDTYIVPSFALEQDITRPEFIADARADWYGKAEPRFARLLDAVTLTGGTGE